MNQFLYKSAIALQSALTARIGCIAEIKLHA